MKVLGNLTVDKDSSVNYPFGANIQNETDTINGTPVIREIYGDVLMNLYRILELTNVTPNGIEDDKTTQFQLVEALKKLPNSLNDIEQVLTLSGSVWSVPFDLSILPNKYFFIARASDNYTSGTTFKGTGATEYNFTSSGFNASDELLVIIDSSNVRAYSLSKLAETPTEVFTSLGIPVHFNDTTTMFYNDGGFLISDYPNVYDLQNSIRVYESDGTLVLKEFFIVNGKVFAFVFRPSDNNYLMYYFLTTDLNTFVKINFLVFPATDYQPYLFTDGTYFYITNDSGNLIDDYKVAKYVYDEDNNEMDLISVVDLDVSYTKTTNTIVKDNHLFTYVSGQLDKYNLSTGIKTSILNLNAISGKLFMFNGSAYFSTGEVGKKWNI